MHKNKEGNSRSKSGWENEKARGMVSPQVWQTQEILERDWKSREGIFEEKQLWSMANIRRGSLGYEAN